MATNSPTKQAARSEPAEQPKSEPAPKAAKPSETGAVETITLDPKSLVYPAPGRVAPRLYDPEQSGIVPPPPMAVAPRPAFPDAADA